MTKTFDFVVVGAGVFGAWTAHYLRQRGASVALLDAYGAANSRASSSGESRVIRMGYGANELYTQWSVRSLPVWKEFFRQIGRTLFHPTGVLWLTNDGDLYTKQLAEVLSRNEIPFKKLSQDDIRSRYPQLSLDDVTWGVLEPGSGVLMARQAVQALVEEAIRNGVQYSVASVVPPASGGKLKTIETSSGLSFSAGTFVFACGPWLPKIFPQVLDGRISPTRQEVFFLGALSGSNEFRPPKMPVWLHHTHPDLPYALPDLEGRGFKIAFDRHGPDFDPDTGLRVVGQESIQRLRNYLSKHIPMLRDAPILEARVCQYENTSNGDFLIDRHPEMENVWLVGGGSGHGFKHGPAIGEYVAGQIFDHAQAEARFLFASKQTIRMRAVY